MHSKERRLLMANQKVAEKKAPAKKANNLDNLAHKNVQRRPLTVEKVATALRRLNGNKSAVARSFRITRQAVQDFIRHHPELSDVANECKETFVDNVESSLYKNAMATKRSNGNVVAQIFILKTLGKERGYVERNELTGANGAPLLENPVDYYERQIAYLIANSKDATTRQQAIAKIAEHEKVGSGEVKILKFIKE
jgi:hypothetical protein